MHMPPALPCCVPRRAAAMLRVSGTLQKSTDVMKLVNDTIKLPEMQRTMFEMSKGVCGVGRPAQCRACQSAEGAICIDSSW